MWLTREIRTSICSPCNSIKEIRRKFTFTCDLRSTFDKTGQNHEFNITQRKCRPLKLDNGTSNFVKPLLRKIQQSESPKCLINGSRRRINFDHYVLRQKNWLLLSPVRKCGALGDDSVHLFVCLYVSLSSEKRT